MARRNNNKTTSSNYVSNVCSMPPPPAPPPLRHLPSRLRASLYWGQHSLLHFRPDKFMGSPNNRKGQTRLRLWGDRSIRLKTVAGSTTQHNKHKHGRATLDYLLEIVSQESHKLISKSLYISSGFLCSWDVFGGFYRTQRVR